MKTGLMSVIFANSGDNQINSLTSTRCMASVPFGGRYRMIDFVLSNAVNAGVSKVAILTTGKYHSLMDHLGSGKAWDLARKANGISIFPPFVLAGGDHTSRIAQLASIHSFIEHSSEDYVLISNTDTVCTLNIEGMLKYHVSTGADITIAYKHGIQPRIGTEPRMVFKFDELNRVEDIMISPRHLEECNYSLNIAIVGRRFLLDKLNEAMAHNYTSISRDVIMSKKSDMKIMGYEVSCFAGVISSMHSYFDTNMMLLDSSVRRDLFGGEYAVYTKVRDEMPAKYGHNASVHNSLIADGCIIEGTVENCILFRGVRISKGAKVKNSILMQATQIGENAELDYVITDKEVTISGGYYSSSRNNPLFFEKETKI